MDNEFLPEEGTTSEETPVPTESRTGPPWEDPQSDRGWMAFRQTLAGVLFRPAETFRTMRVRGSLAPAYLFYLYPTAVALLLSSLFENVTTDYVRKLGFPMPDTSFTISGYLTRILFSSFMLVFLSSLYHSALWMLRGANHGFAATFRVTAYVSGSVALLSWIPFFGLFIAGIWGIALQVIGLEQIHETTKVRVIFAVIITLSVLLFLVTVVGLIMALSGAFPGIEPAVPEEV